MNKAATTFLTLMNGLREAVVAADIHGPCFFQALTRALWHRLGRAANNFATLARKLAERGPPPPPKPHIPKPIPETKSRPQPEIVLPRRFGWVPRVWETHAYAAQLTHLLADPEMIAMIEADRRFGRLLRPVCRMLGIRPPPCLQLPKPAPRNRAPSPAAQHHFADHRAAELQASKPNPPFRFRLGSAGQAERDPSIYHQLYFHPPPKPA